MTKHDALRALIEHAATADNINHLETMFDVVAAMCEGEAKATLDALIFKLITAHPAY